MLIILGRDKVDGEVARDLVKDFIYEWLYSVDCLQIRSVRSVLPENHI